MIRIREISMPPEHSASQLSYEAAKLLKISGSKIRKLTIVRRSVDARKKPDVRIVYTVDVLAEGNEEKILHKSGCKRAAIAPVSCYKPPKCDQMRNTRPVVVGFGPAGMFAALVLALAGQRPIVLERGEDAQTRQQKVTHFFQTGELDTKSNVQFGEGGAGTFSDGKLNTGLNNPRINWVLEQLVLAGAAEEILYDAKPHIGTDVLVEVVQNIRKRIISLGGEIRFCAHVTDIVKNEGAIKGLVINGTQTLPCEDVIFAIGHSARDTFQMLFERELLLEA